MSRVVLLGATGHTGRLTAAALAQHDVPLLLAGRDVGRLDAVREPLLDRRPRPGTGGLPPPTDVALVDVLRQGSVEALVAPGDVLVTTVGPFLRYGLPLARRAAERGWAYVDSTGEPPFVRRLVDELHVLAGATGARLLPATGYDYVPGHLAAAVALDAAGTSAVGVRIGYFVRGGASPSSGTLASAGGMLLQQGYAWRDGRLVDEPPGRRVGTWRAGGRSREALSVAGSEHLFLPRTVPRLQDVDVQLGWAGRWTRLAAGGLGVAAAASRVPGVRSALGAALARGLPGSRGGAAPSRRAPARTLVVAEALDPAGAVLRRVEVEGPEPYALTADLLARTAVALHRGEVRPTGVLGPLEAHGGTSGLARLCAAAGLAPVD